MKVTKWMNLYDGTLYSHEGFIEDNKFCYQGPLCIMKVPGGYYFDSAGEAAADLLIDINLQINKLEEKRKFILSQL